jgi:hypothetical protein
MDHALAM